MNLQHASTLADRVHTFFTNLTDHFPTLRSTLAAVGSAAALTFSGSALAQTAATSAAPVSAASSSTSPASSASGSAQPSADAALQQNISDFAKICANPTYMAWLTRNAVTCDGVDGTYLRLRLETPIKNADSQDTNNWLLYKFGDLFSSFDIPLTSESIGLIARGIAYLDIATFYTTHHTTTVAGRDVIDPALISIFSAGADSGGGMRLEFTYDLESHRTKYGGVGEALTGRVKTRYDITAPIWKRGETLTLPVALLQSINFGALHAKLMGEEQRQASAIQTYGTPGDIVFVQMNPATGTPLATVERNGTAFELTPGIYIPRNSGDTRNFTHFVDMDGDRTTDLDRSFELAPGWTGTVRVQNQYTGTQRLSPPARKALEGDEKVYILRVSSTPTPTLPLAGSVPSSTTPSPAIPASGAESSTHSSPSSPYVALDDEAAGILAPLRQNFHGSVAPAYALLSLADRFSAQGIESTANAAGVGIAGTVGVVAGSIDTLAVDVHGSYFTINNGTGVVARDGKTLGAFTYEGTLTQVALALAYLRELEGQRTDITLAVKSLRVGAAASIDSARISGSALTENEQRMMRVLALLGFDYALASVSGADYNVQLLGGAGVNHETNTDGIDYDVGPSGKLDAALRVRFSEIGFAGSIGGTYDQMSAAVQETREERHSILLAGNVRGMYFLDQQRLNTLGIGVAHTTTFGETSNGRKAQLEETIHDTRLLLTLELLVN
ncbi:MAG: hypothetical protein Q7R76_04505 [Candidatus Woesearchaeota archaeon]|nr:hypothetical protein [Candidatus Woesearchaeota archaeon]